MKGANGNREPQIPYKNVYKHIYIYSSQAAGYPNAELLITPGLLLCLDSCCGILQVNRLPPAPSQGKRAFVPFPSINEQPHNKLLLGALD